jgi:DNA-binding CsgD family transcriptional regulator/tetratricopeptide (TPR) repeat protein
MGSPVTPPDPVPAKVTPREAEILALLPFRLSNSAIAARLVISERTVESHVSALLRKFGSANRRELAELATVGPGRVPDPTAPIGDRRPPPRFVGRTAELSALADELSRVSKAGFRTVTVLGEPGVGKSRLAGEFATRADARCLSARAFPLGATTALSVWIDALDAFLTLLRPNQVRRLCGPFLDDVVVAMPRVAEVFGPRTTQRRSHRRVVDAIATILRRLSAEGPILVVFDDAHLADSTSWNALERLAAELSDCPVLVALTARPLELAAHPVANDVLLRLAAGGAHTRLTLAPLDGNEVELLTAQVLGRVPEDGLAAWLLTKSAGNPLYALGLLDALLAEGGDLGDPSLTSLPESLRERVRAQLRGLHPTACALLEMLAVIGRPTAAGDLMAVSRSSLADLVLPVDTLIDAGLVIERGPLRELAYEIAHPLIAEVVYQNIRGARCRVLHREVGMHLRAAGHLAEASSHFARCAGPGDAEAIDVLREALAEAGRAEAYPEALAILGMLSDVLPRDDPRWLHVLDALSDEAQWVLDHRADVDVEPCIAAMAAMDAVLANSTDLVRRGIVKLRLAGVYSYGQGDVDRAAAAATAALAAFEAAGDRPRALLAKVELAAQHYVRGDPAGLRAAAHGLLEEAEAADDPRLVMHVAGWVAMGAYFTGNFGEADALFRRSAEIAAAHGEPFHRAWSQAAHATTCALAGNLDEALALLDDVATDNPCARESILHECASIVHWTAGQYADAVDDVETALRRDGGQLAKRRAFALTFAAMSGAELARPEAARRYLEMAATVYAGRDFMVHQGFLLWAKAVASGLENRSGHGLPLLLQAAQRMADSKCLAYAGPILLDMADIAADLGDHASSREAARRLDTVATTVGLEFHRGLALLAWAVPGNCPSGMDAAAEAARIFLAADAMPYAGRSHFRLGQAYLAAGQRRAGREALRKAADIFDACGAVVRRRRATDLLIN